MQSRKLQEALKDFKAAIQEIERIVEELHSEKDPLAVHIFVSRRNYRNANDTKSGKRREMNARLSFNTACELGFRSSLDEWERLMGQGPRVEFPAFPLRSAQSVNSFAVSLRFCSQ